MGAKTYDNEGHHFVTRNGTVVAYTRCWHWQKGFQADPSTKERMPTFLMQWRKYLIVAGVESTTPIGAGHSPKPHLLRLLRRRSQSMSKRAYVTTPSQMSWRWYPTLNTTEMTRRSRMCWSSSRAGSTSYPWTGSAAATAQKRGVAPSALALAMASRTLSDTLGAIQSRAGKRNTSARCGSQTCHDKYSLPPRPRGQSKVPSHPRRREPRASQWQGYPDAYSVPKNVLAQPRSFHKAQPSNDVGTASSRLRCGTA